MKMIVTIATCGSALLFTSLVLAAARGHRQRSVLSRLRSRFRSALLTKR